ncbi:MAG: hypothetical protein RIR73_750 [Chloroflexota bacterium]
MKKFMLVSVGFEMPTPEVMEAWGKWFESIADKMEGGSPFGSGREVTKTGTNELSMGADSFTGYTIIHAENIDEAEKIAKASPIITSMRVYELRSM